MTPRDFANLCKAEKESLLAMYFDGDSESIAAKMICEMTLTPAQTAQMHHVVNTILTDCIYGLLLGLDGAASIGGIQQPYQLHDEQGNLLTDGELEAEAWDVFQNQ